MKKVLLFFASIFSIIIITDITIGTFSKYYVKNFQLSGRYQPLDRLIKQVDTDIIFIGNSLILNSVDPAIIQDSMSMTCYNGGITGQGIVFFEAIIDCILSRHTPKMIVLGFRPEELGGNIGDGIYDVLRPYYKMGYQSIDKHFEEAGEKEKIIIQSNLLRYNSIWVRIILYCLFDNTKYSKNGFMPKDMPHILPQKQIVYSIEEPSTAKIECFKRIIKECKSRNVKLCVCFPPTLQMFSQTPHCIKTVYNICNKENVPCFIENTLFIEHNEFFYDAEHLNMNGAKKYSEHLSSSLRHIKDV